MESVEEVGSFIRLRGAFQLALCDPTGKVLEKQVGDLLVKCISRVENTVVTSGRAWVLKQIQSTNHVTSQNLSYIAIGSDTTAPASTQTALGLEVTRLAISSIDTTNLTASPPNEQFQVQFATSDANTTLAEVCLINSSAGGTMLARATFASFVKATSNIFNISYNLTN